MWRSGTSRSSTQSHEALSFPPSKQALQDQFAIHVERRVSNDHVVSIDSIDYEVPRGYAGHKVLLRRALLCDAVRLLHEGRLIDLHPVDLEANARSRRARPARAKTEETRPKAA